MDKSWIREAIEKSSDWFKNQQWFKKKGSVDEKIKDNYKPMVKVSDPGNRRTQWALAPQFQFKIVKRDGETFVSVLTRAC